MNYSTQSTRHLTHEQLTNLLLAARPSDAEAFAAEEIERSREHLNGCTLCASELDTLRQSLALFRSTADAWAQHAWESTADRRGFNSSRLVIPVEAQRNGGIRFSAKNLRPSLAGLFAARPAVWTAAAAVALFAAALPIALRRVDATKQTHQTTAQSAASANGLAQANTSQSDEALLLEINQTLSSAVPAPMQPLADPTAGNNLSNTAAPRKN